MSHIVTIDIQFKDKNSIATALKRLNLKYENVINYKFYDGNKASGIAVYLKDWKYPVVIKEDGSVVYDNYNGKWGEETELNKLKQIYGVEVMKKQLKGNTFKEVQTEDGKIKLLINM